MQEHEKLYNLKHYFTTLAAFSAFKAVGWMSGRASGLQKLSDEVLAWLSLSSE